MNIKDLLQKTFQRFSKIQNGSIIKNEKKKKKNNHAAVSAKVSAEVEEAGKVKVKKPRRRPNSKVKSVDYIFDSENEDSVEEEPVNVEDVIVKIEPAEIESADDNDKAVRTVEGGYKSTDDNYTYIRGRGRGQYICKTCGIRCLNPSMFAVHLQSHNNVRLYTCKHCNCSFKTKGSLIMHNKTKKHSKKCVELGAPVPTPADDQYRPWTLDEDKLIVKGVLFNKMSRR